MSHRNSRGRPVLATAAHGLPASMPTDTRGRFAAAGWQCSGTISSVSDFQTSNFKLRTSAQRLISPARAPPSRGGTRMRSGPMTPDIIPFASLELEPSSSREHGRLSQLELRPSHFISCPPSSDLASMPSRQSIADVHASVFQFFTLRTDQRPRVRLEAGNSDPSARRCGGDRQFLFVRRVHVAACSTR